MSSKRRRTDTVVKKEQAALEVPGHSFVADEKDDKVQFEAVDRAFASLATENQDPLRLVGFVREIEQVMTRQSVAWATRFAQQTDWSRIWCNFLIRTAKRLPTDVARNFEHARWSSLADSVVHLMWTLWIYAEHAPECIQAWEEHIPAASLTDALWKWHVFASTIAPGADTMFVAKHGDWMPRRAHQWFRILDLLHACHGEEEEEKDGDADWAVALGACTTSMSVQPPIKTQIIEWCVFWSRRIGGDGAGNVPIQRARAFISAVAPALLVACRSMQEPYEMADHVAQLLVRFTAGMTPETAHPLSPEMRDVLVQAFRPRFIAKPEAIDGQVCERESPLARRVSCVLARLASSADWRTIRAQLDPLHYWESMVRVVRVEHNILVVVTEVSGPELELRPFPAFGGLPATTSLVSSDHDPAIEAADEEDDEGEASDPSYTFEGAEDSDVESEFGEEEDDLPELMEETKVLDKLATIDEQVATKQQATTSYWWSGAAISAQRVSDAALVAAGMKPCAAAAAAAASTKTTDPFFSRRGYKRARYLFPKEEEKDNNEDDEPNEDENTEDLVQVVKLVNTTLVTADGDGCFNVDGARTDVKQSRLLPSQQGLFAAEAVADKTIICWYTGQTYIKESCVARRQRAVGGLNSPASCYFFDVRTPEGNRVSHYIDGYVPDKTFGGDRRCNASFLNHSATVPNVEFEIVKIANQRGIRAYRVAVRVMRSIERDEELLLHYGESYHAHLLSSGHLV